MERTPVVAPHLQICLPGPQRLEQVVSGFLARYKTSTREVYWIGLKQWIGFCFEHGIDPLAPERPHVEVWARHLEESGRSRATVAHKLNILGSFYKVVTADGDVLRNPMPSVRRPNVEQKSTTNAMSQLQLARVLEVADAEGLQYRCMSQLLAFLALRASTLCAVRTENLTSVAGSLVLTIETKGDTLLNIGIPPATAWHLRHLIEERGSGPLFFNRYQNQMTRANLGVVVDRWAKAAKIKQRITPHSFRHTFVTLARQSGLLPEDIMAVTGHTDERMVSYYDRTPALMRSTLATARIASQVLAA